MGTTDAVIPCHLWASHVIEIINCGVLQINKGGGGGNPFWSALKGGSMSRRLLIFFIVRRRQEIIGNERREKFVVFLVSESKAPEDPLIA
jgi:hypothetical protein